MKKGTPLFDRHSRKKKEKPEPSGPQWREDPEAKLRWMLEQRLFIKGKVNKTSDELRWLKECEERISLLRIACA